jgi:signal transduction histidine kinase
MNTLIIDNKKGYGRKIKVLLEKTISDSRALVMCTVLEALAELRHPHYDLLIIGHQLPEISIDEFLAILTNNNINIPVLIIDHEKTIAATLSDSLESCIFHISADDVPRVLPLIALEAHKRCMLFKENRMLKTELSKAEGNHKIIEIALNSNHHINNPLMTILGNTQLLIRDCETSDSKTIARLEKIEKAAKRIQEITLDVANKLGVSAEPREMLKLSK